MSTFIFITHSNSLVGFQDSENAQKASDSCTALQHPSDIQYLRDAEGCGVETESLSKSQLVMHFASYVHKVHTVYLCIHVFTQTDQETGRQIDR